jgi:hypothetical protein
MRYPGHADIGDPSPKLPAAVAEQIEPLLIRAVANLRTEEKESKQEEGLSDFAAAVFRLMGPRRLKEMPNRVESLRRELDEDAQLALDYAHWCYKLATRGGRMLFLSQEKVERRLRDESETIETEWWKRQADLKSPLSVDLVVADRARETSEPPKPGLFPRDRRTPDTATSRRIEVFKRKIEEESNREVLQGDIPTAAGYRDPTQFQRYQREKRVTPTARAAFDRVLRSNTTEFWLAVERNRQRFDKEPKP